MPVRFCEFLETIFLQIFGHIQAVFGQNGFDIVFKGYIRFVDYLQHLFGPTSNSLARQNIPFQSSRRL